MIDLSDEVQRDIVCVIERWGRRLLDAARDDDRYGAGMYSNWLFGAQTILGLLGIDSLAQAASDAHMAEPSQQNAETTK